MTRDELITKLTDFRTRKIDLTWADVAGAFTASPAATKTQFVNALNARNGNLILTTMLTIVDGKRRQLAADEVAAMIADDSFTTDDLIALLE